MPTTSPTPEPWMLLTLSVICLPTTGNWALLQVLVVGQRVAEQGDEHQQQREQRHEPVVGQQRGVLAGLVVAVLLDHPDREAEQAVPLLEPVGGPQQPLDPLHHTPRPVTYSPAPSVVPEGRLGVGLLLAGEVEALLRQERPPLGDGLEGRRRPVAGMVRSS
jgi:hypothetical protein